MPEIVRVQEARDKRQDSYSRVVVVVIIVIVNRIKSTRTRLESNMRSIYIHIRVVVDLLVIGQLFRISAHTNLIIL